MGWPPCCREGCDRWPSVGHTGVCAECIKVPVYVRQVADARAKNAGEEYRELRAEVARLREALEFYANGAGKEMFSIALEVGNAARRALAGEELPEYARRIR